MSAVAASAPLVAGLLGAGGLGVALSGQRELVRRWLSFAVAAPLVGGALLLGEPGAAALAAGLGGVAAVEYARLTRLPAADRALLAATAAALPLLAWLAPAAAPGLLPLLALAALLPPLLGGDTAAGGRRAAYGALGVLLVAWPLSQLVVLGQAAVPVILAVSVADVGAWCGGRLLGRRGPLARGLSPVSPAKTWAGVVGAAVGAAGVLAALGALTPGLLAAVVLGGIAGDLAESLLKREAGVKDAGTWLPGFGGLLDRVDSLLVALPLAVVLS